MDAADRRLYIARATRVIVVDLDSEKVVGEIAETPGVHGIAFVPDLNRGFTSNGGDSTVTVFDLKTLKTLGKVKANGRPDIIMYEPVAHRSSPSTTGPTTSRRSTRPTMKVVGTLAAGGVPELAVSDEKGHVFCNLGGQQRDHRVRRQDDEDDQEGSLRPGEEPTGLALDPKHGRLFSTCANRKMAVSDADSGKVVQTLEIGPGPDGCVFDADRRLIFSSNGGDGTLTIIRGKSPASTRSPPTSKPSSQNVCRRKN